MVRTGPALTELHTKAVIHGAYVTGMTLIMLNAEEVAVQVVMERGQIAIVCREGPEEMVVWGFTFLNSM